MERPAFAERELWNIGLRSVRLCAYPGIGEAGVDFLIQPVDDSGGRKLMSPPASTWSRTEYDAGIAWRAARLASWMRLPTKKGSGLTRSASGRSRPSVAKAALISLLVLTWLFQRIECVNVECKRKIGTRS
jgi:hypothetical protein